MQHREWLDTLPNFPENYYYQDFIACAKALCAKLTSSGVDLIIALTHMRLNNDVKLAETVPQISVVLGGHDHFYKVQNTKNGTLVVKSGTDFMNMSLIEMQLQRVEGKLMQPVSFDYEMVEVDSKFVPDEEITQMVNAAMDNFNKSLGIVIGTSTTAWDATSSSSRTEETGLGNYLADILRMYYGTDFALLAGGTIRSDSVYGPGDITVGDVLNILPFQDPSVVIKVTGKQMLEALENSVSKYPAQEGRFPHFSGLRLTFDPSKPPMKRILCVSDEDGTLIEADREYQLATRLFMAEGKDGFHCLEDSPYLVDEENGMLLSTLVRHHLSQIRVVNAFSSKHKLLCKYANIWRKRSEKVDFNRHFIEVAPKVDGRLTIFR